MMTFYKPTEPCLRQDVASDKVCWPYLDVSSLTYTPVRVFVCGMCLVCLCICGMYNMESYPNATEMTKVISGTDCAAL